MADDIKRILVPRQAIRRLRPSEGAEARGYLRLKLERAGAGARDCLVPIGGGLEFFLRAGKKAATVSLQAEEAAIKPVGWGEAALVRLRRRFTRLKHGVLNFEGLETFPAGPKKKAKPYGKQVRYVRRFQVPPDGQFIREHSELITGWPAEETEQSALGVAPNARIAVALHLHYVDLWPEIEMLLKRWNVPFTLLVTLTRENAELADRVQSAFPGSAIHVVDNRGRDVRPFLLLLEKGAFDSFELVCKVHGKRSLGNRRIPIFGDIVRRAMFLDLIANGSQVRNVVRLFDDDPTLGVVGSSRFRVASNGEIPQVVLGQNRQTVEAIAARMGSPIREEAFDFFEGTMFWARPQALAPLRRLRLTEDFMTPDAERVDGALEHAIERLFNHAVRAAGFRVADIAVES
jgi:hypothetical protein